MSAMIKVLSMLAVSAPAMAHLAMFADGMYGRNNGQITWPHGQNGFEAFDQWWFGGSVNDPPPDGEFLNLPAGGVLHAEVGSFKERTRWGGGGSDDGLASPIEEKGWRGSLHIQDDNPADVKGCGLAIAYKANVHEIGPEDFTVISIRADCPYTTDTEFHIPTDLPACPEGGCHCMWGWIHSSGGGADENYMTGFRCQVANPGNGVLAPNKDPVNCEAGDCSGAKRPLYFGDIERRNAERHNDQPPNYGAGYGWPDGPQNDVFQAGAQQPPVNQDVNQQPPFNQDVNQQPPVNQDVNQQPPVNQDINQQPPVNQDPNVDPSQIGQNNYNGQEDQCEEEWEDYDGGDDTEEQCEPEDGEQQWDQGQEQQQQWDQGQEQQQQWDQPQEQPQEQQQQWKRSIAFSREYA